MKTFGKALYMLLVILFSMNIGWVIYHWNTYNTFTFVSFEIPKHIYILLQIAILASFVKSLNDLYKIDKDKNKI
ncbi:hypothetical protein ACFSKL_06430 [Belliella marina]|uniref:Solute:sodium symporter small subunit n=1 Tax=Belliella marina TaxID=1644146 RepID=A0ABW4VIA2_9BACT